MLRLNLCCAALLALLLAPLASFAASAETLNISVAASLTDATNKLLAQFKADGHDIQVLPNYGPSGTLAKQINEGAPTHLFISANQKWMDFLRDEKNIDPATERILVRNTEALKALEDVAYLAEDVRADGAVLLAKDTLNAAHELGLRGSIQRRQQDARHGGKLLSRECVQLKCRLLRRFPTATPSNHINRRHASPTIPPSAPWGILPNQKRPESH